MATSLSDSSWFYSSILDGLVWFNDLNILAAASFSIGTPAPNSCLGWRRLMASHPLDPPASTLLSFSFFFLSGLAQRQKKHTKIKARTKKQRQQKHFICLFSFPSQFGACTPASCAQIRLKLEGKRNSGPNNRFNFHSECDSLDHHGNGPKLWLDHRQIRAFTIFFFGWGF